MLEKVKSINERKMFEDKDVIFGRFPQILFG